MVKRQGPLMKMRIFSPLFRKTMEWASHKYAPYYLALVSFLESSFFPVPPDLMLVPMSLARPQTAMRFAMIATLFSVIGGIFGYALGYLVLHSLHPYIISWGYGDTYAQVVHWFSVWGIWVVLLAGFTPIPYKIFTIGAGALHMSLGLFILFSFFGRGARFYLVSLVTAWGGKHIQDFFYKYIELFGWIVVFLVVIAYGYFHLR